MRMTYALAAYGTLTCYLAYPGHYIKSTLKVRINTHIVGYINQNRKLN